MKQVICQFCTFPSLINMLQLYESWLSIELTGVAVFGEIHSRVRDVKA